MGQRSYGIWWAVVCGSSLVLGCQSAIWQHSYRDDPLFVSKKPVSGQPDRSEPTQVAAAEPVAPAVPAEAVAMVQAPAKARSQKKPNDTLVDASKPAGRAPAPIGLIGTAKKPVPATVAVRTKTAEPEPAFSAIRRQVPGNYGHAPDYSWLQGVLDKHYQGRLELRYCDPGVDDPWGGKVCLEEDPRLGQFGDGDVILVQGEMVKDKDPSTRGAWHYYPHYRVQQVILVQRGQ